MNFGLTQILAGVIAALVLALGGVGYLYKEKVNELSDYKATVELAQKLADAEAKRLRADNARVLADVSNAWSRAVDWHRDHPRIVRVRDNPSCLSQVPALSAVAGVHAVLPASSDQTRDISIDQCEAIANDSILDTEWIEEAKRVTNELHEVSK